MTAEYQERRPRSAPRRAAQRSEAAAFEHFDAQRALERRQVLLPCRLLFRSKLLNRHLHTNSCSAINANTYMYFTNLDIHVLTNLQQSIIFYNGADQISDKSKCISCRLHKAVIFCVVFLLLN